jgi:hypothetical protein
MPEIVLQLDPGRLTTWGVIEELRRQKMPEWAIRETALLFSGKPLNASFSDYWELAVLDGTFGDPTTPTITAPTYIALCTVVPTDSSTGTSITEANYTTYARISVSAASMSAASAGSKTNSSGYTGAACTAGSSTIIGWALCDALTVGNMLCWGTTTSTVISTTQTPPTIAVGGLVVTLD